MEGRRIRSNGRKEEEREVQKEQKEGARGWRARVGVIGERGKEQE